jgi:predicted dehydrogenase
LKKLIRRILLLGLVCLICNLTFGQNPGSKPLRIAIDGLTHTHVHWILGRLKDGDLQLVGIAEPNTALARRYLQQYNISENLLFPSLEELVKAKKPEAVAAFNSINQHLSTVRICAPLGIHVMVEKPLAVTYSDAKEMATLARKHDIHLLTNYETTWYASNYRAFELVQQNKLGELRKIVVHDGHPGPKEIGVNKEFLDWLTDPVENGGGAIMDFGCYGANLATWLMKGERPRSVTAITQQIKPDIYPHVDDEATIILTYPKTQAIIQASWNWPYNRKDMEVYGKSAYLKADRNTLLFRNGDETEMPLNFPILSKPFHDPFAYFKAIIQNEIKLSSTDLSSLEINLAVVEILDAAKQSAKEGKTVFMMEK